jgi:hypothetical protein
MTDVNHIDRMTAAQLETYNFSGADNRPRLFDAEQLKSLLDNNQEGVFTLDEQGHLGVINPPARRDNRVLRFFRGLFSSTYKAQQANLDRMESLQRNASFNKMLRLSLVKALTDKEAPSMARVNEKQSMRARILSAQLLDRFASSGNKVRISDIKQAVKNSNSFATNIKMAATVIADGKYAGSSIAIKGENLSPLEFIRKYDDSMVNTDKKLASAILIRAAKYPESFACIGKTEQARELSRLFAKPGFGGSYENADVNDRQKAQSLMQELTNEVNKKMCSFAEGALAAGKDPAAVAARLKESFNALCAPFQGTPEGIGALGQFLGEQGKLASADDLAPAQDPAAYTAPDPANKNYDSFMKLKQEFPDLSNRQLGQIVNFLVHKSDNEDKTIKAKLQDKYIAGAKSGGAEKFRTALRDLQKAAESHNAVLLKQTGQDLLKLFMDTTGTKKITEVAKDKIADFSAMVMHYAAITAPANELKSINTDILKELQGAMGKHAVFRSNETNPEAKLILQRHACECATVTSLLLEVKNIIMPATDNFDTFDTDTVSDSVNSMVKNTLVMGQLELPQYQAQIDNAVSSFPEDIRDLAKNMLTDIAKSRIARKGENPGAVINEIAGKLKDAKHLTEFLKIRNVTQEQLETFKNSVLSMNELKKNYQDQIDTKHVTGNTLHDNVLRDVDGLMITGINDVDLIAIADKKQRKDTAKNLFMEKVPQNLLGFVTNYVQQGGMGAMIYTGIHVPAAGQERLIPDCPSIADLMKDNALGKADTVHNIKIDDNTIEITSNITVQAGFTNAFGSTLILPHDGQYELCQFTVVTKIDISQGTLENGVPKGISLSIAKKES